MDKNKLTLIWSKRENDFLVRYPTKPDGHLVHNLFDGKRYNRFDKTYDDSFVDELKKRGYDLKTLRFEIKRLPSK